MFKIAVRHSDTPVRLRSVRARSGSRGLDVLIYRCAGADEDAFAELYDATVARVYGLSLQMLRSNPVAQEAAHETYLEIWRTAARFDADRCSAITWIIEITLGEIAERLDSENKPPPAPHPTAHDPNGHARHGRRYTCEQVDQIRLVLTQVSDGVASGD